jgi:hypothetical protein
MHARTSESPSLRCPSCERSHPPRERFCRTCGIPLVQAGPPRDEQPQTERHERARKIKPQLAEGPLVRVVGAHNQAEGEFIQGLLLEEGVPSMLRRSAGFDVPDFLAAGPRDVMVPQAGFAAAQEILLEAELIDSARPSAAVAPVRLLIGLLSALAIGAGLIWLISELLAN